MNDSRTLHATLYGVPACRRYRRFKQQVVAGAAAAGVRLALEEVNAPAALARFNPLTLPRLVVEGQVVASRNPPAAVALRRFLERL